MCAAVVHASCDTQHSHGRLDRVNERLKVLPAQAALVQLVRGAVGGEDYQRAVVHEALQQPARAGSGHRSSSRLTVRRDARDELPPPPNWGTTSEEA